MQHTKYKVGVLSLCFALVFGVLLLQGCSGGITGNTVSENGADDIVADLSAFNEQAQDVQSKIDSVSSELTDIEDDYSAVKEAVNEQIQTLNKRDTESNDTGNDTGLNFAEQIATIKDFQDTLDDLKKDVSSLDSEADAIEEWLGTVENQELYNRAETYKDLISIYTRDQTEAIKALDTFFETLQDDLSAYEKGNYKSFDTIKYKEYARTMEDLQSTMVALRAQQNKVNEFDTTESEE